MSNFDPHGHMQAFDWALKAELPGEIEYGRDEYGTDPVDVIHEFVDGWVPVYSNHLHQLFGHLWDRFTMADIGEGMRVGKDAEGFYAHVIYGYLYEYANSAMGDADLL